MSAGLNGVIIDDLEWPLIQVSRSLYTYKSNISFSVVTTTLHHCCSSCTGCQCQNEWHSNCASWCIAVCMVSALNTSRRTSGSCPRFILASDCVRPPILTSWFLPLVDRAFPVAGARAWNALPPSVSSAPSLSSFRRLLKTLLFQRQRRQ